MAKAQASIEFLLLITAFVAALGLLLPAITLAEKASLLGSEARNAESFLASVKGAADELRVFSEGTERIVAAKNLLPWRVHAEGKTVFVSVKENESGKGFTLSKNIGAEINFTEKEFREKISLRLWREGSRLLVEDSQP
ncbi:MAG: hypothetical protein V1494_06650 [Candidatus Diapherotrites archaeon]